MPRPPTSRLRLRVALFVVIVALFALAAWATPRVAYHFTRQLAENYSFVATEAIRGGDPRAAERIVQRRLGREFYDFDALYLLAEAQDADGRPADAAATIKQVLTRLPGALARGVASTGYDEAKTYARLAIYLHRAGAFDEAAEMARAALDVGTASTIRDVRDTFFTETHASPGQAAAAARLALRVGERERFAAAVADAAPLRGRAELLRAMWMEQRDRAPLAAETHLRCALSRDPADPLLRLGLQCLLTRRGWKDAALGTATRLAETTGTRTVALTAFTLPTGADLTTNTLRLTRTSAATTRANTGVYRVESLLIGASGTRALGLYPILVVRNGEDEVARFYLDSPQPQVASARPWPDGAPKTLDLRLDFVNDGYDPVSKADRNVELYAVAFH